jgi:thioredoxin-like negative regulator of GroEL
VSQNARVAASRVEPAQRFQVASQLHRQGRLAEAEQLYGAILEAAPEHFGALYCLAALRARRQVERGAAIVPACGRR